MKSGWLTLAMSQDMSQARLTRLSIYLSIYSDSVSPADGTYQLIDSQPIAMPGRPSTRASIASNLSRKPSHRHSRHTPSSSLIPEESPPNELRTKICNIFGDAQHATTGHRKLVISLRKVQEACVYEHVGPKFKFRHNARTGEDGFREEIMRSIVRVMNIKKSEPVGDRLVRFMGLFLKYAGEQGKPLTS